MDDVGGLHNDVLGVACPFVGEAEHVVIHGEGIHAVADSLHRAGQIAALS